MVRYKNQKIDQGAQGGTLTKSEKSFDENVKPYNKQFEGDY